MGPQGKVTSRFTMIPDLDHHAAVKERMISGSGSVSGSPGRIHDNISRDSGIGCLKVVNLPSCIKIAIFDMSLVRKVGQMYVRLQRAG